MGWVQEEEEEKEKEGKRRRGKVRKNERSLNSIVLFADRFLVFALVHGI